MQASYPHKQALKLQSTYPNPTCTIANQEEKGKCANSIFFKWIFDGEISKVETQS